MNAKRLYYSVMLWLIPSAKSRADYLRRKHVFASIGTGCSIMKRKIPLYPNLIKIGDNVHIASNVSFLTHDITHTMLKKLPGGEEIRENIGCIEVGNNVFIGSQVKILPNVRIGSRCIVGTGSIITHDIPDNSIVAGIPARVIGSFDTYFEKRKEQESYGNFKVVNQEISTEFAEYLWKKFGN